LPHQQQQTCPLQNRNFASKNADSSATAARWRASEVAIGTLRTSVGQNWSAIWQRKIERDLREKQALKIQNEILFTFNF
jgi:hypothetical protein